METLIQPDELFELLMASAKRSRRTNLAIVHEVCRGQFESGSRDFTVATIARLASARGGPAAQSIHNKAGDCYKSLIKTWAQHAGGATVRKRRSSHDQLLAALDQISDVVARSLLVAIVEENKRLKQQLGERHGNERALPR